MELLAGQTLRLVPRPRLLREGISEEDVFIGALAEAVFLLLLLLLLLSLLLFSCAVGSYCVLSRILVYCRLFLCTITYQCVLLSTVVYHSCG